jgi:hypothetical protein
MNQHVSNVITCKIGTERILLENKDKINKKFNSKKIPYYIKRLQAYQVFLHVAEYCCKFNAVDNIP